VANINTERPLIALATDFGLQDNYVGIMKGVIFGLNPKASLIDISHEIPPGNIAAGRYILETSYGQFPPGTIYLAVVDPGVGTARRPILIETENYFLIGPDNGLFSFLPEAAIRKILNLNKKKYFLKEISATFHGRDIFAPVAGYLSLGVAPEEMGGKVKTLFRPQARSFRKMGKFTIGTVIYIDHFGNLVTSLKKENLPEGKYLVHLNQKRVGPLRKTFGSVEIGEPVCYINSFGYLEIAIREGSAAENFEIDYSDEPKILIAPV
jgi:S-adenosyl-L-methionine hydrolase (adenosine-forming)